MNYVETIEKRNRMKAALEQMYREEILPTKLSQDYHIVSCLKHTETKRVYVLKEIHSGSRYILKCGTGREAELLHKEFLMLDSVEGDFLPKPVSCFSEQDITYLLREYIAGETLEQKVDRIGVYSIEQAITVMLNICQCVQTMHEHVPQLIHRDIKPQNIIVTEHNNYMFIDMDTVREYKKDGSYDTVCVGTRETAAPEQFGFRQSDVRSDIYSLGILFLYLMTGCYSINCAEWKNLPVPIQKTVLKCLAFDPKNRYRSVKALYRELTSLKRFFRRRGTVMIHTAMGLIAVVTAVMIIIHSLTIYQYQHQSISFENPQIEAAVRQTLEFDDHSPITQSDLEGITTLILCGGRTFQSWEEHEEYHSTYWSEFNNEEKAMEPVVLSDLQYLPNLHTVALDNQGLESLADLQGLSLNRLSLRKNSIANLDGIEENSELRCLNISDNPLSEIESLAAVSSLYQLNISGTSVESMDVLEELPLTLLDCTYTNITDYSTLTDLKHLTILQISGADSETIAQINTLTNLEILGLFESDLTGLEELSDLKRLECIDITLCYGIDSLSGIDNFPKLNYLGIAGTEISDISAITELNHLEMLDVTNAPIDTLNPIKECENLHMVFIDSGKEAVIQQMDLRESLEIIVNQ